MRVWSFTLGLACLFLTAGVSQADEKEAKTRDPAAVAKAIDRELEKRLTQEKIPTSAIASDGEFLRRVYVDITGRIPTAEQAATFLDSKDPDKRAKLIDELLANPNYGQHFGIIWSDLIVKRFDNNRNMNTAPFKKWLADSFNENKPWNAMVREMMVSEGTVDASPAATFYVAHRDMNVLVQSRVVGTVANLFMGLQLQCAECHNHAFIRDWKQTDFWGMAAFFAQTRSAGGQQGQNNTPISISEGAAAAGGARPGGGGFGRPNLTGARLEIPDATDPRRRTGKVVQAKFFLGDEPKMDKAPYRPTLVDWLTSTENKYFAPAAVNRMWALFFARGFVNPLDDMHEGNPPTHPELLKALADEFRASDYDLKHLIRAICNSQAYQRTSKPLKDNDADTQLFSHQTLKVMHPEVLYDSLCTAMGVTELRAPAGGRPGFGGAGGPRGPGGGSRGAFVNFFNTKEDSDDATEMSFGIPQFLRLMNSRTFSEGSTLIEKMVKEQASPDKVIETLYLATLSRRPTEAEAKKFAEFAAKKESPKEGYNAVLWVLMNSAEFVCVR